MTYLYGRTTIDAADRIANHIMLGNHAVARDLIYGYSKKELGCVVLLVLDRMLIGVALDEYADVRDRLFAVLEAGS